MKVKQTMIIVIITTDTEAAAAQEPESQPNTCLLYERS